MDEVVSAAQAGWLQPEVIEVILSDPVTAGFQYSTGPPVSPCDGQLYLFDQTLVKHYKQDGINWVKKKGSGRVQEVHQKISINGFERITGFYSTSADDLTFRRRTYRLSAPGSSIFLVHYRKCERYKHAIKIESRYNAPTKQNLDLTLSGYETPSSDFMSAEESANFPILTSQDCSNICCTQPSNQEFCGACKPPLHNMSHLSEEARRNFLAARHSGMSYAEDNSMYCDDIFAVEDQKINRMYSGIDSIFINPPSGYPLNPETFDKRFDTDSFEFFSWNSESDGDFMQEEMMMDDDENVQKVASLESEGDRHRFEESRNPRTFFQQNSISNPSSSLPFVINSHHPDQRQMRPHHSSLPTSPFGTSSNCFSSSSMQTNNKNSSDNPNSVATIALSSGGSADRYNRNRGKVFRGKNMNLNLSSLKRDDGSIVSPRYLPPDCLSGLHFPEGIGLVLPQTDVPPRIMDFSPCLGSHAGGEKILVCLSAPLFRHTYSDMVSSSAQELVICFGGIPVPCESLSPTVLRCFSPALLPRGLLQCQVWVATRQGKALTSPSPTLFAYTSSPTPPLISTLLRSSIDSGKMSCSNSVATAQSRFSSSPYQENPYQIDTREHKLRIVERLGTVGNALQSEVFSQQNSSKIPMIGPGTDTPRTRTDSITGTASAQETKELTIQEETVVEVIDPPKTKDASKKMSKEVRNNASPVPAFQWLDDAQLAELSTAEVEDVLDRYLLSVVQQLVQLVSVEDDLRVELDALDASGFALLHYCCLYNLTSLVLVLLKRGANIDQKTGSGGGAASSSGSQGGGAGCTALHLAAGAGHLPVVKILLESGADVIAMDQQGRTPLDSAELAEKWEILDLLTATATNKGISIPVATDRNRSWSSANESSKASSEREQALRDSSLSPLSVADATPGCLPLSFSFVEQLPHQAHAMKDESENAHTAHEDNGSVSSLGGENLHVFDFPGSPRSPLMSPQNMGQKRLDAASTSERLMLQDAFSSLSLADKCALSVSLGPHSLSSRKPSVASCWETSTCRSKESVDSSKSPKSPLPESSGIPSVRKSTSRHDMKLEIMTSHSIILDRDFGSSGSLHSPRGAPPFSHEECIDMAVDGKMQLETMVMGMQSMISQSDKQCLDVAMSMMGQQELDQVEDEVKKIQNNVRGWMLRKNYVNLRDAAKILQVAWRGKKKHDRSGRSKPSCDSRSDCGNEGESTEPVKSSAHASLSQRVHISPSLPTAQSTEYGRSTAMSMSSSRSPSPSPSLSVRRLSDAQGSTTSAVTSTSITPHSSRPNSERFYLSSLNGDPDSLRLREEHAAATLQAATRAMIARKKSFIQAKRQAMASLVIQKSFLHWWVTKEHPGSDRRDDDLGRKRKDLL